MTKAPASRLFRFSDALSIGVVASVMPHVLAESPIVLTEQTAEVGLSSTHGSAATGLLAFVTWMSGGMAVGDFNRDGWQDLFWLSGGDVPDKLFINNGDGTFIDRAAEWGVAQQHLGCGASVGDCDNDGWPDIYVTSFGIAGSDGQVGKHRLYHNQGGNGFLQIAEAAGVATSSASTVSGYGSCFGDYDLDGDLDLFVASWGNEIDGNRLFQNNGLGEFEDVTESAMGIGVLNDVWGFQPAFVDMNDDLYPELLLAADFKTSRYFINNGDGTFTDVTVASGTGLDDNGMGQAVADFDNDGMLDWYVTSIHKDNPQPDDDIGNMLYMAVGEHTYSEQSVSAGVNNGGWGWGTVAADLDHDGWTDIVEVNGRGSEGGEWDMESGKVFRNLGGTLFEEIGDDAGLTFQGQGRALVKLDADNDGDLDIVSFNNEQPLMYYENVSPDAGHWLRVQFNASNNDRLPPDGFGTRIEAHVGDTVYKRYMSGDPSYLATSEHAVHIGLGDANVIDTLNIYWSRGYVSTMTNVAADQHLMIHAPHMADLNADGSVGSGDLAVVLGTWGTVDDSLSLLADFNNDGVVGPPDLAIILGHWGARSLAQ